MCSLNTWSGRRLISIQVSRSSGPDNAAVARYRGGRGHFGGGRKDTRPPPSLRPDVWSVRREGQFGDLSVVSPRPSSGHDHPPGVLVETQQPGLYPPENKSVAVKLLNIARLLYISVTMHMYEGDEEARTYEHSLCMDDKHDEIIHRQTLVMWLSLENSYLII